MMPNNLNTANRGCTDAVLSNIRASGQVLVAVREANVHPTGQYGMRWVQGGGVNMLWLWN